MSRFVLDASATLAWSLSLLTGSMLSFADLGWGSSDRAEALGTGGLEREPWARFLGLALGFLALLRFPFGTALGIYTLWVLLPETSAKEYERLTQPGGQVNSAPVSS